MIGLSLSFCVADIIHLRVLYDDVEKIFSGTCMVTDEDWESVLGRYSQTCWFADPQKAREVALRLKEEGKIIQPRVENKPQAKLFSKEGVMRHWVEDESEILWEYC